MNKLISSILMIMFASVVFGQNCLEGFDNVAVFNTKHVGDIIITEKSKEDVFMTRARLIKHIVDTSLLAVVSERISSCTHDITRGVKAGADVGFTIDIVNGNVKADRNRITKATLVVEQGYVEKLRSGRVAFDDCLEALSTAELKKIRKAMDRGGKFSMVTQMVYVEKGYTEIKWSNTNLKIRC